MLDTPPLSRLARFREAGEEWYCRRLEGIALFARKYWTYLALLYAFISLPGLLLPTFNSGGICMVKAAFQVFAVWLVFQVMIAWISYFALQTVAVWPFWLMLFLHLFSTGVALDKMKLENLYCQNILAIRSMEEVRGKTRFP